MIPIGEYLPDISIFGTHLTQAINCIPVPGGYVPFHSAVAYSDAASETVLSAAAFVSTAGTPYNFAGTDSYLLKITSAAWEDVSKAGTPAYNTGSGYWDWAVYGNRVIATNGVEKPQSYVMGTSTDFADLTSDDVIARTCAVVRDFVFFGYTTESATAYPYRVRWSALGDPTDFTSSVTTQSDYQDLQGELGAGPIKKIVGGEYATIFCENGIFRATYIGGDTIFSFDQIVYNTGTVAPQSVVSHGNMIFFLSDKGFMMMTPGGIVPIGEGKVSETIRTALYADDIEKVSAVIDPERTLYIAAIPTSPGTLASLYIYNWTTQRWTTVNPGNIQCLFKFYSESTFTDSATAYDSPDTGSYANVPTDSKIFVGGAASLAAVNQSGYAVLFNGEALNTTIVTGYVQLNPEGKTLVTKVVPIVEGYDNTVSVAILYKNTPQERYSVSDVAYANSEGECNLFNVARYQSVALLVTGWYDKIVGFGNPTFRKAGKY